MSKLMINDLVESTELDSKAMAGVYGGEDLFTIIKNRVSDNDATSAQAFDVVSLLKGTNTNIQTFEGGNGVIFAPVKLENDLDVDVRGGDTSSS